MAQKEQCFIITPIGDDTDPIRRHIEGIIDAAIIPALGDQYEIVVAHKISEPGSITKQVIDKVYHSKLVIANLTNRNPNVMYELALRHATGKPAIMIAEKGTPLPSDIIMQRTIFYHNDAKGVLELRDALKKAAYEIDFEKKVGPIVEVLGDISHDADMLKKVAEKDSDSKEPLEYIIRRLDRIESSLNATSHNPDKTILMNRNGYSLVYSLSDIPPDKPNRVSDILNSTFDKMLGMRPYNIALSYINKSLSFMIDLNYPIAVDSITEVTNMALGLAGFGNAVLVSFEELPF